MEVYHKTKKYVFLRSFKNLSNFEHFEILKVAQLQSTNSLCATNIEPLKLIHEPFITI